MSTIAEAEKAVKFNVFYAKKNVVDSIWKEAIIEGVNITYPQAKVIVEHNQTVEGLTVTGTITVYNLNLGENGRLRCSVIFVVPNFLVMEISERHSSWQTRC